MNIADFPLHFLRPWWWLVLAPLPLALWLLARSGGRAALERLADAALLPHLVHGGSGHKRVALVRTMRERFILPIVPARIQAVQRETAAFHVKHS